MANWKVSVNENVCYLCKFNFGQESIILKIEKCARCVVANWQSGRLFGVIWWGTDWKHLSISLSRLSSSCCCCSKFSVFVKCANWWLEAMNACPRICHCTATLVQRPPPRPFLAASVGHQSGKLSKSNGYDYESGHFPLSYWPPNLDISVSEHFLFHYALCSLSQQLTS